MNMQMSTKKYAFVQEFFDILITNWNLNGYKDLAQHLNIPYQTLMAWKKRNSIGDYSVFMDKGILKSYLETGEGNIFATPTANNQILEERIDNDEYIKLPHYEVEASAGAGIDIMSEQIIDYLSFKTEFIKNSLGVNPKNVLLIAVKGDSMTPTYNDGDMIMIDTTQSQFKSDAVYVLRRDDILLVKRVQFRLDGTVIITSDNQKYPSETYRNGELEHINIIGRVVWRGGR